jgi:Stage II sporulation protein E (SpoIIE)/PAS fold/GAF domain
LKVYATGPVRYVSGSAPLGAMSADVQGWEQLMHQACTRSAWPGAEALALGVAATDAVSVTQETPVAKGLMQSPLPAVIFNAELQITWANEAAGKVSRGRPASQWRGRRLAEVLPGMDVGLIERSLRSVLETGRPVADLEVSSQADDEPGGERFWSCVQFPIKGRDGDTAGVVHIMWEITQRAQSERRHALADLASARIGTALDTTRTAEELLEVAVPGLADVGAVDLLTTVIEGDNLDRQARGDSMRLQRVAMRWARDSAAPPDYARASWLETDPTKLYHERLVAGLPTFVPDFGAMSTDQLREMDSGTGLTRMLAARAAGAQSMIVVPLTARGVIMGIVILYRLTGSRPFSQADLALARDLVARAAVSIDNARLYTRERASALALQRGLLPRRIPDVPGLELAYRYVPAETAAEVGGDWFDVITLGPERCALIVGDVTGHDMRAASLMGQLRTATRTLAMLDLTPSEILTRLDRITADLADEETSATCVYAVHDTGTGTWEMARAGHPLPAVVRPGREATFLDLPPGTPLGVGGGQYETVRVQLPRESTLVLYTDGLIETRTADLDAGMARLADTLDNVSALAPGQACDSLLATLAPKPADDIAVLMVRT